MDYGCFPNRATQKYSNPYSKAPKKVALILGNRYTEGLFWASTLRFPYIGAAILNRAMHVDPPAERAPNCFNFS